jgi:hypothetical protein
MGRAPLSCSSLKPDNQTSVLYFFMSWMMAIAALLHPKAVNENVDLQLSAFTFGKIWFKILNWAKEQEVLVSCCTSMTVSARKAREPYRISVSP